MDNLNIKFHDTLNQNIWKGETLKKEVKETLDRVAEEFIKFLKIDVKPLDIRIVGSSANYNYTDHSDIDLHILVDFSKIKGEDTFVKEYFDAKKYIWNTEHDIMIYGHEIECYVQGVGEKNVSAAIYSLKNSNWVKKPKKETHKIDTSAVRYKAKDFAEQIELAKGDLESLTGLKDKLKKMRRSGLDTIGEYSVENLVFKVLRNSGKIKKMLDYDIILFDKALSLKELHESEWIDLVN